MQQKQDVQPTESMTIKYVSFLIPFTSTGSTAHYDLVQVLVHLLSKCCENICIHYFSSSALEIAASLQVKTFLPLILFKSQTIRSKPMASGLIYFCNDKFSDYSPYLCLSGSSLCFL